VISAMGVQGLGFETAVHGTEVQEKGEGSELQFGLPALGVRSYRYVVPFRLKRDSDLEISRPEPRFENLCREPEARGLRSDLFQLGQLLRG